MYHHLIETVTSEIRLVLDAVEEERVRQLAQSILSARTIVVHGAGRVGLSCKAFSMRLGHLGRTAYVATDSTVPPVGSGDLVIVASSSGETQTTFDVGDMAKKNGAQIGVITATTQSRIGGLADVLIELKTQTKSGPTEGRTSIQPMATLFEQSLQILFDLLVLMLMSETHRSHADMWSRHSNID
ncbi:MAG: SIS domain-containing protein [Bacteroidetes bacterium]|nr:SIS domain-containing protein [Bacteroidota bacterium]MCW5897360.1 SIS domain-containing protein [Bacteroidota bacterium]